MPNIKQQYSDPTMNIVFDTIDKHKQAIVFANTKNSAEKTAEEISKKIKQGNLENKKLAGQALNDLAQPTRQCKRLAHCLKKGVAFHHSGLTAKQKELIEENFRKKTIKLIVATPTLAMGVDVPAFRVILKNLKRFGYRGMQYIPVLEYMQMAGRAGRPKFDNRGEAVIISTAEPQKDELTERYIKGEPEPIFSKLAVEPVLRTYVLSLIATDFTTTKKTIFDFFSKTFWAYQYADTAKLHAKIETILQMLEEWELIIASESSEKFSDFKSALDIAAEDNKYKATILGKRVAELYIDPYTAHFFVEILQKASSGKTIAFSFLQIIASTLEIRPQLRARVKDRDKIQEALLEFDDYLLVKEPSIYDPDYGEYENAAKTALFMHAWIEEKSEESLLEEYNIRPGEIKSKLDIADWLIYCMEEIVRILQFRQLSPELRKLRARIKNGVKEELLPLLKFRGIGRARARKLFRNSIRDVKAVKESDLMKLSQILGKNIAISIKKQLGQEVKEIKQNKRKGQISLRDY
ncbi:hypothetical protein GF323_05240 [Candidatus Woesearchaeota archaeon]|nr:hypothetical protein [Candidatus Woesearchaeota archaeon]